MDKTKELMWLCNSLDETPMDERYYSRQKDRVVVELGHSELYLLPDGTWFMNDTSGG